jgi:hypothetical protein
MPFIFRNTKTKHQLTMNGDFGNYLIRAPHVGDIGRRRVVDGDLCFCVFLESVMVQVAARAIDDLTVHVVCVAVIVEAVDVM